MARGKAKTHQDTEEFAGQLKCCSRLSVNRLDDAGGKIAPGILENDAGLGFLSAVFDNIPLTALALEQDGYDWGMLAYAVGFGGSMIWFGSSAGVAISSIFPEARSVSRWIKGGWFVAVAYVAGFFVMLMSLGWHPQAPRHRAAADRAAQAGVLTDVRCYGAPT